VAGPKLIVVWKKKSQIARPIAVRIRAAQTTKSHGNFRFSPSYLSAYLSFFVVLSKRSSESVSLLSSSKSGISTSKAPSSRDLRDMLRD
jgi:hypothetical protein